MRASAAFLCDSATVRENLLHVLGGGITRLFRAIYPAPIEISLAVLFELEANDAGPHDLSVRVTSDVGQELMRTQATLQARLPEQDSEGLPFLMPLVVGLRGELQDPGLYQVELSIDGGAPRILPFRAELPPAAPEVGP